jgi:hypothetical protein
MGRSRNGGTNNDEQHRCHRPGLTGNTRWIEKHANSTAVVSRNGSSAARWQRGDSLRIIPTKKASSASETPNSLATPNATMRAIAKTGNGTMHATYSSISAKKDRNGAGTGNLM